MRFNALKCLKLNIWFEAIAAIETTEVIGILNLIRNLEKKDKNSC
jgi:hypothetical protein